MYSTAGLSKLDFCSKLQDFENYLELWTKIRPTYCLVGVCRMETIVGVCRMETIVGVCRMETIVGVCRMETIVGVCRMETYIYTV